MTPLRLTPLEHPTVSQIIAEGMALLEDPGVQVHNAEALRLLAEAGASISFSDQIARIPERMVHQALESAPKNFYLYNLQGEPVVQYGGDAVHFDPGSAAVTILDSQTHQQRPPKTGDLIRLIRLVESLPSYDAQSTAIVCRDVPEAMGDFYRLYLALNYMQKPIITGAFGKKTWWTMYEMLVVVAGSEANLVQKPIAVFDVCPTPPLLWSDLTCQNLIDCARKGVPAELVSMPLAGATAPVTLAASVVQHTAESLSGLVLSQLANPGAPIVWGGAPAAFDMRQGTTPMGDVSTWLIDLAYIQMGKALGLPTHTYMGSSDAKTLDVQSGLESAGGTILAALSGVNMVSGAGMLDFLRCQSLEKLVIDAEIILMAKHLIAGISLRDDPIALEIIRRSGHHADHLAQPHTHRWFRQELYLPSAVIDRGTLESWQKSGSQTAVDRARQMVETLIAACPPNPLRPEQRKELHTIAIQAARQCGLDKLPQFPIEPGETNVR